VISSEHRFHGRTALKFVYQNGQVVRGPFFSIKYAQNPRRKDYRAAVVVSRKVDKSAVVRNRLRRRLYEALRHNQDRIKQPVDIVITVFSANLDELSPAKLERQLKDQLKAAKILGPKTPAL
jgi:ribonuclease P protein component